MLSSEGFNSVAIGQILCPLIRIRCSFYKFAHKNFCFNGIFEINYQW